MEIELLQLYDVVLPQIIKYVHVYINILFQLLPILHLFPDRSYNYQFKMLWNKALTFGVGLI